MSPQKVKTQNEPISNYGLTLGSYSGTLFTARPSIQASGDKCMEEKSEGKHEREFIPFEFQSDGFLEINRGEVGRDRILTDIAKGGVNVQICVRWSE